MYDKFVQSLLHKSLYPTYGFRILGKETQDWLYLGINLCFDSDKVHSQYNEDYAGNNHETKHTTMWHRNTAEKFCQGGWWKTLRENSSNSDSCKVVAEEKDRHQHHQLFANHTMESLLHVGYHILPELNAQLHRAQKVFSYWSWLPWLSKRFLKNHQAYLNKLEEGLGRLQKQLNHGLQARILLALESPDGQRCDVLMSLVERLRKHVPTLVSEERIKESQRPLSSRELLQGKKRYPRPPTWRATNMEELTCALKYLYDQPSGQKWFQEQLDEILTRDAGVSNCFKLKQLKTTEGLLFVPADWFLRNDKSSSKQWDKAPWHHNWTLENGLALLHAQMQIKKLASEEEYSPTNFSTFESLERTQRILEKHQEVMEKYKPNSFIALITGWKNTSQYRLLQQQKEQLDKHIKNIEQVKIEWILSSTPKWLEHSEEYSSQTWGKIIVTVSDLIGKLAVLDEFQQQRQALELCYRQLLLASAMSFAKQEELNPRLLGTEVLAVKAVQEINTGGSPLSGEKWNAIKAFAETLKESPILLKTWQECLSSLFESTIAHWCNLIDFCCCDENYKQSDEVRAVLEQKSHLFFQYSKISAWWFPDFVQNPKVQKAYQQLNKHFEKAKQKSRINSKKEILWRLMDTCSSEFSMEKQAGDKQKSTQSISLASPVMSLQTTADSLKPESSSFVSFPEPSESLDDDEQSLSIAPQSSPVAIDPSRNGNGGLFESSLSSVDEPLREDDELKQKSVSPECDVTMKSPEQKSTKFLLSSSTVSRNSFFSSGCDNIVEIKKTQFPVPEKQRNVDVLSDEKHEFDANYWIEEIKQGLLKQTKPKLNKATVDALLDVSRKMARDGAVDIMAWSGRSNLFLGLYSILAMGKKPEDNSSLLSRIFEPRVDPRVKERRLMVNIVARLYQCVGDAVQAQQRDLADELTDWQSVITKTPELKTLCHALNTNLQARTLPSIKRAIRT